MPNELWPYRGLRDLGFSKRDIREAVSLVRKEFGDEYGLASQRIDTDGVELFVKLADASHITVSAGQGTIAEVLRGFLKGIHWNDEGRPEALRLERYSSKVPVIIDPRFAWGTPSSRRRARRSCS